VGHQDAKRPPDGILRRLVSGGGVTGEAYALGEIWSRPEDET